MLECKPARAAASHAIVLGPPSRPRRPQVRFFGIRNHGDKIEAITTLVGIKPQVQLKIGTYDTEIEVRAARVRDAKRSPVSRATKSALIRPPSTTTLAR